MNTQITTPLPTRCPDKAQGRIAVTYRPTSELKLDPNNPRCHSRRQIRKIAQSITAFGFNVPILIDANLTVVAGHGRPGRTARAGTKVKVAALLHYQFRHPPDAARENSTDEGLGKAVGCIPADGFAVSKNTLLLRLFRFAALTKLRLFSESVRNISIASHSSARSPRRSGSR